MNKTEKKQLIRKYKKELKTINYLVENYSEEIYEIITISEYTCFESDLRKFIENKNKNEIINNSEYLKIMLYFRYLDKQKLLKKKIEELI